MELIGALVYYIFSLTNIFLLLFILKSILSQSKIYPFNKTDPYSEFLFILIISTMMIYLYKIYFVYFPQSSTTFYASFLLFIK